MKVTINQDECIDCGVCYTGCPDVFEEDEENGVSQIVARYRIGDDPATGDVPESLAQCVRDAADACAVEAIHVEA